MATPRIPSQNKANNALKERLNKYVGLVQSVFDSVSYEAARIASSTGYDNENGKEFRFSDYPKTKGLVEEMQKSYVAEVGNIVMRGTSREWKESNLVQDAIANKCIKSYNIVVDGEKQVYLQTNDDALKAFQHRKDKGMNLSQKLWKQSADVKEELESAISCGLSKGTSAVTLSKRLSQYLVDFDSLKEDYKERFGQAISVKDCEYNSIRLARSEINMAYRRSEQERWEQMDFVVEYEIHTSTNRHRHTDICDELQGKYPKDFEWYGWHPNCTCYRVPILKTKEEFFADEDKTSVNEVTDLPDNFKIWYNKNLKRIEEAEKNGTLPYFISDNTKYRKQMYEMKERFSDELYGKIKEVRELATFAGEDISKFEHSLISKDVSSIEKEANILIEKYEQIKRNWASEMMSKYQALINNARKYTLVDVEEKIEGVFSSAYMSKYKTLDAQKKKINSLSNYVNSRITTQGNAIVIRPDRYGLSSFYANGYESDEQLAKKLLSSFKLYKGSNSATVAVVERLCSIENYELALQTMQSSMVNSATGLMYNIRSLETIEIFSTPKKWQELCEASSKDLRKIPSKWRARFNEIVNKVNGYNLVEKGYEGVWREMQEAYNVFKLSNNEDARKFGLYKLSPKMPESIITGFKKIGVDILTKENKPNKKLFDLLDSYVPCISSSHQANNEAHHNRNYHIVRIDFLGYKERCSGMITANRVVHHEYGHALANGVWENDSRWKDLLKDMQDWYADPKYIDKAFDKDAGGFVERIGGEHLFNLDMLEIKLHQDRRYKKMFNSTDIDESMCAISDIFQAISPDGTRKRLGGHDTGYYESDFNKIAEIIANTSGIYWSNERYISKKALGIWYDRLMNLYKEFAK